MVLPARHTILCVASYFKGNRFIERCKREGCHVMLLTVEAKLSSPWARDSIDEVHALPSFENWNNVIHGVAYLMRTRPIDRIVALDDFDVELAAALREHFRLPGLGQSRARFFRDKLAMRYQARSARLAVPAFTPIFHHEDVRQFLETTPAPWLLKPRMEASAIGIQRLYKAEDVWNKIHSLEDRQSFFLLERMLPGGELYHVDSLIAGGSVVFAAVSKYHRPLLEVYQDGGIFASRTLAADHADAVALRAINENLLNAFRLGWGCSHTEFMRASDDGKFYFIETSARVGGANISDMVEAANGLNLWEEWAKIEIDFDKPYQLPPVRNEFGGVTISLARQDNPDTSAFDDVEIYHRVRQDHHICFVLRSPSEERLTGLLEDYMGRIARDHQAVLPPAEKASA
ncbi:ATPase [soil metagenome]